MPYELQLVQAPRPSLPTRMLAHARYAVRSLWLGPFAGMKDPALTKIFGEGESVSSGVAVTPENAFTFSAVFDAVSQGSSDLAKTPLNLRKRREDGGSDLYTSSKLYRLLKDEPNPDMSSYVFRRTLVAHAMTLKGGFAEIERDSNNQPAALWPLTPDRVEPVLEKTVLPNGRFRSRLRYRIDNDNRYIIESRDMIHLRGLGYDGYQGYGALHKARQAIGLALAAEKFAGEFFGNNSNLGGVLAAEQTLDATQSQDLQARIEQNHKGPGKAWRLLVLGAGFKYFRTGVTPNESQMNDLRSKQVEEVARFFNFPVHKLKNLDRATNNNIEQQALEYLMGFILDWVTNLEQEFNRKLIAPLEARQQFIKHNLNAFMRADAVGRTALYSALLDRGVFSADDVLELEDRNPQPNGQGKLYLVQGAMVPKDKIVALVDAQIEGKKPPPAPAPPPPNPANDELVRALEERIRIAEEAARAGRESADTEMRARAALDGTVAANGEEIARRLAAEQQATAAAAQSELVAAGLRVELAAVRDANEAAAAAAQLAERTAREELAAAHDQVSVAAVRETALRHRQTELEAERNQATLAAAEQRQLVAAREQTVAAAREQLAVVQAALTEATGARTVTESAVSTLRSAVETLEHALAEARAQLGAREETARATADALAQRDQELSTVRQVEASAMAAVIAAHRGVVVDIMRRMVERETTHARRAQSRPDRLPAWVETFYDGHADLMRTALLPVVRVHLAFVRSTEDPVEATRRFVVTHVTHSERQIRQVLDGDADEVAASLPALLARWDAERSTPLADLLMEKELEYARRL